MVEGAKYTLKNQKVVVVSKPTPEQFLVQEIFVSNGEEKVAGKCFLVNEVFDAPVETWWDKEKRRKEGEYRGNMKKLELSFKREEKIRLDEIKRLSLLNKYTKCITDDSIRHAIDSMMSFLTGKARWVVVRSYDIEIVPFSEFCIHNSDGLRLFTLCGRDDGSFTYRRSEYRDGSGSSKDVYFCKTKKEACLKFKELAEKRDFDEAILKTANEFGIKLNKAKIIELHKTRVEQWEKQQKGHKENTLRYSKSISLHKKKIRKLEKELEEKEEHK